MKKVSVDHYENEDGSGTLAFTCDFPALYEELIIRNDVNLGHGAMMGLRMVLLGLKQIGEIAIKENHQEIMEILSMLGIVELD